MKKRPDNNQRGSALLLTLGILSLVLILAMSFAFTARTNRQVAKVNADQVKARLLAESGWQRARAVMEWQFGDTTYDSDTNTYTKTGTSYYPPMDGRLGFSDANKLTLNDYEQRYTAIAGTDFSEESYNTLGEILSKRSALVNALGLNVDAPGLNLDTAGFQTVLNKDNDVVGRLGYLFLEEGGKFDINQLVSPNANPNGNIPFVQPGAGNLYEQLAKFDQTFNAANDFYYNILGNYSVASYAENATKRLGLCIQELIVDNLLFVTGRPQGFATTRAEWFSYDHLKRELGTTFTDKYLAYRFFSGKDIEAYWDVDTTTYSSSVERQRFDITGFEWRDAMLGSYYDSTNKPNPNSSGWQFRAATGPSAGTPGASAYARALVAALVNDAQRPKFWDGTDPTKPAAVARADRAVATFPAGFGIPALKSMKSMTESYATLNQQVAANLVDYCDSDSWATVPATVTWAAVPAAEIDYCGNEKVPYFNEVACRIIVDKSIVGGYTYRLRLVPAIEMVNIFEENLTTGDCRVRITGTWKFDDDGAEVDTDDFDIYFDFTGLAVASTSYATYDFLETHPLALLHEEVDRATDYAKPQYSISIANVYMVSGVQDDDDKISEAALWKPSPKYQNTGTVDCVVRITSSGQQIFYLNLEAEDPRCNHRSEFWALNDTCADDCMHADGFHTTNHRFTLNGNNNNFTPDHDGTTADKESGVTFAGAAKKTFSTAFIRNAPMETLWELGAIHRGEPYRTINLKKFSATVGDYTAGDALILDQVKIGPAKFCRGKFNPNSRNPQAIADLLSGIDATAYDDMATTGGVVDAVSISFTGSPSQYRGQFVDSALSGLVSAASDDRTAEAYIGKTAQLLSTRQDAYTVIVVAQAIRDLTSGGVSWTNGPESDTPDSILKTLINPTKYTITSPTGATDRYCSILATQVMMAHVVRDAWKNEYEVIQIRYLED